MEIEAVKPNHLEMHRNWKEARKRLRAPEMRPTRIMPQTNITAIVPPTVDPTREVMDFTIAAVANHARIPVNEVLSGISTMEVRAARSLAIALCRCRLGIPTLTIAEYFEVPLGAVKLAAKRLNPIMIVFLISNKTPIELSLPMIWGEWQKKESERPRVIDIQAAVCEKWRVTLVDLLSQRRVAEIVEPRHAAMAIAKELTLHSLPEIGRRFEKVDHTTVLHAVRKMAPVMESVRAKMYPAATVFDWVEAVFQEIQDTSTKSNRKRS